MAKTPIKVDEDFDFGIEFTGDIDTVVQERSKTVSHEKAEAMYNAILPLLNNLKKNPDKPTIVWPDREKKIDEFIDKLKNILYND
jgi:hypothetical protein